MNRLTALKEAFCLRVFKLAHQNGRVATVEGEKGRRGHDYDESDPELFIGEKSFTRVNPAAMLNESTALRQRV